MLERKSFLEPPSLLHLGIPWKGPTEVVDDGNSEEIRTFSNFSTEHLSGSFWWCLGPGLPPTGCCSPCRLHPLLLIPGMLRTSRGLSRNGTGCWQGLNSSIPILLGFTELPGCPHRSVPPCSVLGARLDALLCVCSPNAAGCSLLFIRFLAFCLVKCLESTWPSPH